MNDNDTLCGAARREAQSQTTTISTLLLATSSFFLFAFVLSVSLLPVPRCTFACSLRSARSLSCSLADCPLYLYLFLSFSFSQSPCLPLGILIISLRSIPLDCTHAAPASYWPAAEKYATLIVTSARRRQQQQQRSSSSVSSDDSSSSSNTNGGRRQFKKAGKALQQNV